MAEKQRIEITAEIVEKARAAESAEEIAAIAREEGVEMSPEEAEATYAALHGSREEIADDELDDVAGGGCSSGGAMSACPACGMNAGTIIDRHRMFDQLGKYTILTYRCDNCGNTWKHETTLNF